MLQIHLAANDRFGEDEPEPLSEETVSGILEAIGMDCVTAKFALKGVTNQKFMPERNNP